ncbi:MAG TPA: SH3 domain-containing protein [Pyrinomonadaceae bacterium]|nr:SH3 domain-containing protein [Pyrinomonadaceae bacterium]
MNKCPQCNTVYGDEVVYCLNDGTALIEETFSLPSDLDSIEAETVIRHEPFVVNFDAHNKIPDQNINHHASPPIENVVIVPAKPVSNSKNYALFLLVGFLIGGGLVLATLLLSKTFNQNENADSVKTNQTEISVKTIPTAKNKNTNAVSETILDKHNEATAASDEDFNGRVIVLNVRVRSAPSADAAVVDTLPMNDRLDIIERENPNSPWYQVECEHGASGWMHGNTIEFTR